MQNLPISSLLNEDCFASYILLPIYITFSETSKYDSVYKNTDIVLLFKMGAYV